MKHTNKIVSMLLALLLVMSCFMTIPFAALAANPTPDTNKDGTLPDGAEPSTDTATDFSGGDGTETNPYQIKDVAEFRYFQSKLKSDSTFRAKSYILTGNVYYNQKLEYADEATGLPLNVTLADANSFSMVEGTFSGTFDGANYGIYNIYNRFGSVGALFSTVTGTIKNLNLYGGYVYFKSGAESGSLAQKLDGGTISNCYSSVGIYSQATATGGIVGKVTGNPTIEDCVYAGAISAAESDANQQVGGIVARAESAMTIARCANYAAIRTKYNRLGGIVGFFMFKDATVTMTDCVNYGALTSETTNKSNGGVGGLVGLNYSVNYNGIVNYLRCANYGDITGTDAVGVHGIHGDGTAKSFLFCANYGSVSGKSASGLIETANGDTIKIENCYADGALSATSGSTGLIAGWIKNGVTFKNCVGTGAAELYGGKDGVNTIENNKKYATGELNIEEAVRILNTGLETPVWKAGATAPEISTLPGVDAEYTVTFRWYDETNTPQEDTQTVSRGEAAMVPVVPQYVEGRGYFSMWSTDQYQIVMKNLTVNAIYAAKITITFLPETGDEPVGSDEVLVGHPITEPEAPVKEGYRFDAWSPKPETLTESGSVRATYVKVWTVRFFQPDGTTQIGDAQIIDHEKSAAAPTASTVEAPFGQRFAGWDKDYLSVTSDLDVTAVLTDVDVFTVNYYDADGTTLLHTEQVMSGDSAKGYTPDAREGYRFAGWDGSLTSILKDTDVKAVWLNDAVAAWDGKTASGSLAGSGTEEDPYLITSAEDFICYINNAGTYAAADTYARQTADIDLNLKAYGTLATIAGTYDGGGHMIFRLKAGGGYQKAAMFDTVTGVLKNLTVFGANVVANNTSGATLCLTLSGGTIENCHVKSTSVTAGMASGLVDTVTAGAKVRNCSVDGKIASYFSYVNKNARVAGIVGYIPNGASATVENCVNYASLSMSGLGLPTFGGIFASASQANVVTALTIRNCINYGTITQTNGTTDNGVGGILGNAYRVNTLIIENCANYGKIQAVTNVGGILGRANWGSSNSSAPLAITGCVNHGEVKATGDNAGGIFGAHINVLKGFVLTSCANYGDVTGANHVGGLVGYNSSQNTNKDSGKDQPVTLINCYVNSHVQATGNDAGLAVGFHTVTDNAVALTLTNCVLVGRVNATTGAGGILGCVGTTAAATEPPVTLTNVFVRATVTVPAGAQAATVIGRTATASVTGVNLNATDSRFAIGVVIGTAVTNPATYYDGAGVGTTVDLPALGTNDLTDQTVRGILNTYANDNGLMTWSQGSVAPELSDFYQWPVEITNKNELSHAWTGNAVSVSAKALRADVARIDVIYYSLSDLETPLSGAPAAVGTYKAVLRLYDADGNELDVGNDISCEFEITKAKTKIIPDLSGLTRNDDGTYSIEYTGQSVIPEAALKNLATDEKIAGISVSTLVTMEGSPATAIVPGIYVITYTFGGNDDLEAAETVTVTVKITKKKLNYPANIWTANGTDILADGATLTYNRLLQTIRLLGVDESLFAVTYEQNEATDAHEAVLASAMLSLRADVAEYYELVGERPEYTLTWTIAKASSKAIIVRDATDPKTEVSLVSGYEYTGSTETYYVIFVDDAGNILNTPENNVITIDGVGDIVLDFTYAGTNNYLGCELKRTITIKPKNLGENGGSHANLDHVYDGKATEFAPNFGEAPAGTTWKSEFGAVILRKNGETYEEVREALRGGEYRVTFTGTTVDGKYQASFTVNFTITRKVATIKAPETTDWTKDGSVWKITYDGKQHPFDATSDSDAVPNITYLCDGDTAPSANAPKDAATYTVTVTLAETDNYQAQSATFTVRVDKLMIPTVPNGTALWDYDEQNPFTYDKKAKKVDVKAEYRELYGKYLQFTLAVDEYKATATDAGDYTAKVILSLKDTRNTRFAETEGSEVERTLRWSIKKLVLSVSGVTLPNVSGIYNGKAYTTSLTLPEALEGKVNVRYEWTLNGETYTGAAVNAGVYSVVAILTPADASTEFTGGLTEYRTDAATVTILKNTAVISVDGQKDFSVIYDGKNVDLMAGLKLIGSDSDKTSFNIADYLMVTVTLNGETVNGVKDVGTYLVTVSVKENANVTAESFTRQVTVNRATYTVDGKITVVGDTSYVEGKAGNITLRVDVTGLDGVTVTVDETRLPTLPNTPGTHSVIFYLKGSDNYEPLEPFAVTVTVKQAAAKDNNRRDVSVIFENGADPDVKLTVAENEIDEAVKDLLDFTSFGDGIKHPKLDQLYRYTFKDANDQAMTYDEFGEVLAVITLPKKYQGYTKEELFDMISVVSVTYQRGVASGMTVEKPGNIVYDSEARTLTFKVAGPNVAYGYVREASPVAAYVTLGLGGAALIAVIALTVIRIVGLARSTRPEGPDTPDGGDAGFSAGYGETTYDAETAGSTSYPDGASEDTDAYAWSAADDGDTSPAADGYSAEDTLAEDTPAEDTPAEDTPAEETPTDDFPAEGAASEDTPAGQMPVPDEMPTPDGEMPHDGE